jgi:hypothetical protein
MNRFRPWLLLLGLVLGCVNEEPVLIGIPEEALLSEQTQPDTPTAKARASYEKSGAVYVDVRFLGGKPYLQVRDILTEQLGPLQGREAIDGKDGVSLEFLRGSVRIMKGTIAMLTIPLPKPMRRAEALEALGFPPYVGGYTIFHREYRLHHEWGFRRIRLKREDRRSERVIEVEAWRWLPGERELGR